MASARPVTASVHVHNDCDNTLRWCNGSTPYFGYGWSTFESGPECHGFQAQEEERLSEEQEAPGSTPGEATAPL